MNNESNELFLGLSDHGIIQSYETVNFSAVGRNGEDVCALKGLDAYNYVMFPAVKEYIRDRYKSHGIELHIDMSFITCNVSANVLSFRQLLANNHIDETVFCLHGINARTYCLDESMRALINKYVDNPYIQVRLFVEFTSLEELKTSKVYKFMPMIYSVSVISNVLFDMKLFVHARHIYLTMMAHPITNLDKVIHLQFLELNMCSRIAESYGPFVQAFRIPYLPKLKKIIINETPSIYDLSTLSHLESVVINDSPWLSNIVPLKDVKHVVLTKCPLVKSL
jgi:hypothetical protein